MSFFNKIWTWMKAFGSEALDFLEPFGKLLAKSGGALLMDIAISSVMTAQKTGLGNAEKRDMAFKQIKKDAEAKGLNAADKLINATLELALIKITSK